MLNTPISPIEVQIDGQPARYVAVPIPLDHRCPDLDGRYAIRVSLVPDSKPHTVSCRITDHTPTDRDSDESGENLDLKSFYKGAVKLSIGTKVDAYDGSADYQTAYLSDGMQYILTSRTQTAEFLFGIAWINGVTAENELQTWFGADPTVPAFQ